MEDLTKDLFCPDCGFILFLKQDLDEGGEPTEKLLKYCKNCNYQTEFSHDNTVVFKKKYGDTYQVENKIQNDYLIYDPTLPRISNIDCINASCISNSNGDEEPLENEIIFIKFDEDNMKYLYLCKHCKASWTNK
jgi:DNA-directed RNA polymerase subunit M/transcription elongation factor TFIIS